MPVVSIDEGQEVGTVNSFLIDPDKRRIAAFILNTKETKSGVKCVAFESVKSFGSFALTISHIKNVSELTSNSYFISLFEKDIMLIGGECCASDGKLLGFIKDIGIETATGMIQVIKITSDEGFLSPYHAIIPFAAVKELKSNGVVVSRDHSIEYKKDTPFSDEQNAVFVPLVSKDTDLKQLVNDRINSELQQIRREFKQRLFEQHEEYFITRQKAVMEKALTESLQDWLDIRLQDARAAAAEHTSSIVTHAIKSILDSKQIRVLKEELSQNRNEIMSALEEETSQRIEHIRNIKDKLEIVLSEFQSRIESESASIIEEVTKRVNASLAAQRLELFSRIEASAKDASESFRNELRDVSSMLNARCDEITESAEKSGSELREYSDNAAASIKDEIIFLLNDIDTRQKNSFEEIKSQIERISSETKEIKNENADRFDGYNTLLKDTSDDIRGGLELKLNDAIQEFSSALRKELQEASVKSDSKTKESITDIRNELIAELDRASLDLKDKAEEMLSRNGIFQSDIRNRINDIEKKSVDSDVNYSKTVFDLEERLNDLAVLFNELTSSKNKINEEIASDLKSVKDDMSNITSSLKSLEARFDDTIIKSELDAFREIVDSKYKELFELQNGIRKSVRSDIEKLEFDLESKDSFNALREEISKKLNALTNTMAGLATNESVDAKISSTAQSFKNEIEQNLKEIKSQATANTHIEFTKDELIAQIETLIKEQRSEIETGLSTEIVKLNTLYDAKFNDIEKIKETINEILETCADDSQIKQIDAQSSEINSILSDIETLKSDIRNISASHENSSFANDDARMQIEIENMRKLLITKLSESAPMSEINNLREHFNSAISKLSENIDAKIDSIIDSQEIQDSSKKVPGSEFQRLDSRLFAVEDNWKTADQTLTDVFEEVTEAKKKSDELKEEIASFKKILNGMEKRFEEVSKIQTEFEKSGKKPKQKGSENINFENLVDDKINEHIEYSDKRIAELIERIALLSDEIKQLEVHMNEKEYVKENPVETMHDSMRNALESIAKFRESIEKRNEESLSEMREIIAAVKEKEEKQENTNQKFLNEELKKIKITIDEIKTDVSEPQEQIVKHEFADEAGLIERLEKLAESMKGLITREEALQLQDDVVQDAIIQIDARFAGVASKTDIEELQEAMRSKLKLKMDSLRDFIFDALEGKIDELKSSIDSERIERIIEENVKRKIHELGI